MADKGRRKGHTNRGTKSSLPPCRAEQWRAGHGPGKKPLLMKRIDSGRQFRKGNSNKGGFETWAVERWSNLGERKRRRTAETAKGRAGVRRDDGAWSRVHMTSGSAWGRHRVQYSCIPIAEYQLLLRT